VVGLRFNDVHDRVRCSVCAICATSSCAPRRPFCRAPFCGPTSWTPRASSCAPCGPSFCDPSCCDPSCRSSPRGRPFCGDPSWSCCPFCASWTPRIRRAFPRRPHCDPHRRTFSLSCSRLVCGCCACPWWSVLSYRSRDPRTRCPSRPWSLSSSSCDETRSACASSRDPPPRRVPPSCPPCRGDLSRPSRSARRACDPSCSFPPSCGSAHCGAPPQIPPRHPRNAPRALWQQLADLLPKIWCLN